VYGSYDCPEVWVLRRFRDKTLSKTMMGKAFIKSYYAISPKVVKCFGRKMWFNTLGKFAIGKLVTILRNRGIANSHYMD